MKDLRSAEVFWPYKSGIISTYPTITSNCNFDVLIIGAGISGALMAEKLSSAGLSVCVVDRRHCGYGSTSASTAMLQYELDVPLYQLIPKIGKENAVNSYKLCADYLKNAKELINSLGMNVDFKYKESFQYAHTKKHDYWINQEFLLRNKYKIAQVEKLSNTEIKSNFHFEKTSGILSNLGAEVDPFKFTYGLLNKNPITIYDHTKISHIEYQSKSILSHTESGFIIKSKFLVVASGYESEKFLSKKVSQNHSSFAIVSKPFPEQNFWKNNCLVWETGDPYLYFRTTSDNRILVGGKDESFYNPEKRDSLVFKKSLLLKNAFIKLYPKLDIDIDYSWAGTFGKTEDGLPFIGSIPERPNTFFSLGFGGNGIVFSLIAADAILSSIQGKPHLANKIFAFNR